METKPSLTTATAGLSTFLSFGAKSVHPDVLEKMLIGRLKTANLLEQYVREIATNGINQQVFMVGPRGSGKTHLLRVLYHRVQDLVQSRQVVVAYFAEEEYGISGYLDFLIRIINAFMRWYDADKPYLTRQLDQLRETPETRQENVAETLISEYVSDKPLLILSENFDGILEALGKQGQAKLRAWLYRHNRISIIATAQAISPDLGREDQPFYGFFTPIYLKKLSYDDSLALLVSLAEAEQNPTLIAHLAGKGKAQVRAINELVKGNHRLLVTFYEFLKADSMAELSVLFMKTMNDLKPYYETFIRYLPAQQQKILHHLALARTPQRGTDIAKNCFIPTASLTKQLSELQRRHLIDALTDTADKRNKLYDVAEPLLRIAIEIGEQKEGITSLFIDFLAIYYSADELKQQKVHFETKYLAVSEPVLKQKLFYETEARTKALQLKDWLSKEHNLQELEKVKESQRDADYYTDLGVAYYNQGAYEKAIRSYQKAIALKPDKDDTWNNLGIAYGKQNVHEQAVEAFQQALALNPEDGIAWYNLGLSYEDQGAHEEAVKAYQRAIDFNPDADEEVRWWNTLGVTYYNQSKYEQAISAFQRAIALEPDYVEAWFNLGLTYSEQGAHIHATNAFQKVVFLRPDDEAARINIGNVYLDQGLYEQAIESYQQAIAIEPEDYVAWYNLGISYDVQDMYKLAFEAYQRANELDQSDEDTIKNIADVITSYLKTQAVMEAELTEMETWLQGRTGLEIITTYVSAYRRVVFGKDEQALLELPKEQRAFFEREILGRSVE
ncbi:tetratricopeptide repeat protein [Fibrella aquatica]|uniref:tetratricopeptide repeat protein n=1 Tax=Fibrella aquatica TaxID=3242487 RepID=UPI00352070F8